MKKILHLISQDDQPIGSRNKSCDVCGSYIVNCDKYTERKTDYTKKVAEKHNLIRCSDK